MGLKKSKELDNGTVGEYWVAETHVNMMTKQTDVLMLLFKDKAARDSGKQFLERIRIDSLNGIYLTGEQVYTAVKASKKQINILEPAVEEIKDDEDNITQKAKEAVTEEVETNWFADAEDLV